MTSTVTAEGARFMFEGKDVTSMIQEAKLNIQYAIDSAVEPIMADQAWAEGLLKRLTYKPNWTFRAIGRGVRLEMKTDHDTSGMLAILPGDSLSVTAEATFSIDTFLKRDEAAFFTELRQAIHRLETHEADEWLKIDGDAKWNPHRPWLEQGF